MDCFRQPLRLCIAAYARGHTAAVDTKTRLEQPKFTGAEQQTLEGLRRKRRPEDGTQVTSASDFPFFKGLGLCRGINLSLTLGTRGAPF